MDILSNKLQTDIRSIVISTEEKKYVAIKFYTTYQSLDDRDLCYLEKIVSDTDSDVALGLFENIQPSYYLDTDIFLSEHTYMGGPEGEYDLEFINVTHNVKYGARTLFDFEIDDISTRAYGYRIRLYKYNYLADNYTEYVTDYSVVIDSIPVGTYDDLYNIYARPCLTIRNLAYRGRNNTLKYNMCALEATEDFKRLNTIIDSVETDMETMKYQNEDETILTFNNIESLEAAVEEEETIATGDAYISSDYNALYDIVDAYTLLKKYKG